MLQLRTMLLRPRHVGWIEPSILSARQFSVSRTSKADSPPPTQSNSSKSSVDRPRKRIPPAQLKFNSPSPDRPRPRRIIDARSLAASKPGGQPANILKGPRRSAGRGGTSARTRKPYNSKPASRKSGHFPQKYSSAEDNDTDQIIELENVYRELAEKTNPTRTRYQPEFSDLQSLSETWPSLPTDITATTAGISEKLSLLSERYPNGYVPPYVLGKRLFEGKFVQFRSEEEQAEALDAAKKFAQEAADKLSQEKGELVDPEALTFKGVESAEHSSLVESLVQGKYPTVGIPQASKPTVIGEVLKSLRNNETYQASGKKTQFMAKLESLLTVNRPAKSV
ncbi:hypothetical protein ASPVEDRAFT_24658 [Aspergillus versicolor CBS 583.65]|uniref:Uncharacterized protein n=1 Tax=Aspergillus versicolor CBS 583.65 TaxID=1036611 RepID=A0A1L9P8A9_ASPVE|nr:uncharacterized protein ASPVEDRAFT_24658 [Aspergillus versicolor CBS 583.65]OJI97726.1 hypothetical protein ASPVEDRAFT_24658 [Aspergillus versicolor CBS 583.65]